MDLAVESGDFRLMDRKALDALLAMPERNRFLTGMTVWIGFSQIAVPFVRQERHAGVTKYPLRKMLRFSFDAITSFSSTPLQWATILGFIFSIAAFLAIPLTVVARYANIFERGVPSTIIIVLLLGGIQLITLGIIGEYIGRIYDEVKLPAAVRGRRTHQRRGTVAVRIAVLGAGVAGLVAGLRLTQAGHTVDVYERWPRPSAARRRRSTSAAGTCSSATTTTSSARTATSRRSTTSSACRTSWSG